MDTDALGHLVARQYEVAAALQICASDLAGTRWVPDPAHREAAAALHERLGELAAQMAARSDEIAGLADRMAARAAAVIDADADGD